MTCEGFIFPCLKMMDYIVETDFLCHQAYSHTFLLLNEKHIVKGIKVQETLNELKYKLNEVFERKINETYRQSLQEKVKLLKHPPDDPVELVIVIARIQEVLGLMIYEYDRLRFIGDKDLDDDL
jgi:hypothetical protein